MQSYIIWQLCEECLHLIYFLTMVCKSGKPKSVEKNILYGPNTLTQKPETRNALCAASCICKNSKTRRSMPFTTSKWFVAYGLLLLLHGSVS